MVLPVITLMGATASGKTRLAMALYAKYPQLFRIINVDSALIYRGMTIGTAKPSPQELASHPHDLVDILDPSESYSVGNFQTDVTNLINQYHSQKLIPILVGGTMMYYRSLLGDLDDLPSATVASRQWVLELQQNYGNDYCHQLLKTIDPPAYQRLHPNDHQRVGRVLEIWFLTGKGISEISHNNSSENKNLPPLAKEQRLKPKNKQLYNTAKYNLEDYLQDFNNLSSATCLARQDSQGNYRYHDAKGKHYKSQFNLLQFAMYNQDRDMLHLDIKNRLDDMFRDGILDEVKALYDRGDLDISMPAIRCVGYRELWDYFDGTVTLEQVKEHILQATRQLAKRQITWLRSWPQPFTQIHTNISVEQQMALVLKVLRFSLEEYPELLQQLANS